MLSQIATDLTIALSKQISNTSFVIYSWEDIAALLSNEEKSCSKEECKNIFEEIRLNGCLIVKYKDDEEVCFSMTDKALVLTQELEALSKKENIKETMVKTDESGHATFVMPTTQVALDNITKKNSSVSSKAKNFFIGFLGGIVGGAVLYAIIEIIKLI